jgi:tRNA(fMet)-specific endonuclease VapC
LRAIEVRTAGVSSITVAELQYGVAKSSRPEQNALALAALLAPIDVLAFDDCAAAVYGAIRAELERAGTPIGSMDLLIAAHARALRRTLLTDNKREFGRVAGLKVENWAEE